MDCTRRSFLQLSLGSMLAIAGRQSLAQGVATHTAKPLARPAPSGKPFNAHFVDVAPAAGLTSPTIYGGVETNKYIVESTGCGCAFLDFDNDGWMDIFFLCGSRVDGAPSGATIRLFEINLSGTFRNVPGWARMGSASWGCAV